jgi:acetyltransferase-like isoleucine patch superfamily enzyme
MDENSILAYDVDVFNVAPVHLKRHAMVSQNCYLYPGSRALNNSSERLHTPMEIGENAWVASNCFLGNGTIVGRECVIGAGSVVRVSIPAYATVIGNPAKIVGFRYTLEEIIEKETTTYKDCTPIAVNALEKNYEKYFLKRVKEIKDITRL